jgi:Fic family protein
MERDYYIKITNDLYKITLLFPKKEPLRYRIRELSLDVLADPKEEDLEILDRFFEVAKKNNWVSLDSIGAVQSEYVNLREILKQKQSQAVINRGQLKAEAKEEKSASAPKIQEKSEKSDRQEKILDFLKNNEKAQVWEMKKVFPKVSKRTLRRDFEFLLKRGSIQRSGERNSTFYQIKV